MTKIKFGTSGWRAVLAEDFTLANVKRAVNGIARYVAGQKASGARVIVGRDPRFMGELFVEMAAGILATHGITPLVIAEPAPTPAIAHAVMSLKTDGAINFTASHNPPEYNGIKFSTPDGAPALPEVTKAIEGEVEKFDAEEAKNLAQANTGLGRGTRGIGETIDVRAPYLSRLREIVDLDVMQRAGLRVIFDPLWGAARGYADTLLREAGVAVETEHDTRDVLFGGHAPEPDGHLLEPAIARMRAIGAHIAMATDGDADRFGVVDRDGTFIQPNYVIALLFDYLVETRGWRNGVAKSVATTNMINALAEHYRVPLYETAVGFKYIGELIKEDKIAIGGEESAGLSIRHHVPEKDGILAGLLCCEMVAKRGATMGEMLRKLFAEVGSFYPRRENFHLTPEAQQTFTAKLRSEPREFGGRGVRAAVRTDGLKLVLDDGSWVGYRVSGTEPVVRVYTEARSPEDLDRLSAAAKQWIFS